MLNMKIKKILIAILVLSLVFMFSGCKDKEDVPQEAEVVSSETNADDEIDEDSIILFQLQENQFILTISIQKAKTIMFKYLSLVQKVIR